MLEMTHVYLDYNASAPLLPSARKAMFSALDDDSGAYNASSVHYYGREGRKYVEQARARVAELVGADANQVVFNSGATEGNNTVIRHFAENYPNDTILVSALEHPSVLELASLWDNIKIFPVQSNGLVDIGALETMLDGETVSLVSCMFVNNETGIIQDVVAISKLAHKHGALFHCDAVQAAGRIPVDMKAMGIDFLTLSSHKIGGPQGVGAMALGLCGQTPTLLYGGGQEKSARAGTENLAGIVGFGAAAAHALSALEDYKDIRSLRDKLEQRIKEVTPDLTIYGEDEERVANTSFFSVSGADAQSLLMALDLEKIAVSNGSACSSGTVKPSAVLQAMGVDEKNASSALRVSMGWATKEGDVDAFIQAWEKVLSRKKNKM